MLMSDDASPVRSELEIGPLIFTGLALVLPALVMLGAWVQPWVPIAELLRDPLAVAELSEDCCHVHYGLISSLGVLVWWAGAAVGGFAAVLLFARNRLTAECSFLGLMTVFTAVLTADDLLMLHDVVFPSFGIPQLLVVVIYAPAALALLWFFRATILANNPVLFLAAGGFLASSMLIDKLVPIDTALRIFVEDGAKLFGISLWTAFLCLLAFNCTIGPRFPNKAVDRA